MSAGHTVHLFLALVISISCSVCCGSDARADTIGEEDRFTAEAYRKSVNLTQQEFKDSFGAIGKITCPWIFGTVFLAEHNNVVVTSAHIFRNEQNKTRGSSKKCKIRFLFSKRDYYVDPKSIVTGFDIQTGENFDWAVAKLTKPTQQLKPLILATIPIDTLVRDPPVLVVSAGHFGWKGHKQSEPSFGSCRFLGTHEVTSSPPLAMTDCDGGGGSSGSPLLKTGAGSHLSVVALMQGKFDFDEPQKLNGRDWKTVSRAIGVTSALTSAIARVAGTE